jgi:hypothetical protein
MKCPLPTSVADSSDANCVSAMWLYVMQITISLTIGMSECRAPILIGPLRDAEQRVRRAPAAAASE